MGQSRYWFTHGYKGSVGCKSNDNPHSGGFSQPCRKQSVLELRVNHLMEQYKYNQAVREEILGKLQMYRANITIARIYHDKKGENTLTKEFMTFLNRFDNLT